MVGCCCFQTIRFVEVVVLLMMRGSWASLRSRPLKSFLIYCVEVSLEAQDADEDLDERGGVDQETA